MMSNVSIETLKGVGAKKKLLYSKMGIETTFDLLNYLPYSYEDRRYIKPIGELKANDDALVKGKVVFVSNNPRNRRVTNMKISIEDESGRLDVFFFNAKYLTNVIVRGKEFLFHGKVSTYGDKLQMVHPQLIEKDKYEKGIIPVYNLTKGVSQNEIRKNIKALLTNNVEEYLPEKLIKNNGLCPAHFAIENIHFPKDKEHLKIAKYRMIYEELFVMQLGLERMKSTNKKGKKMEYSYSDFEKSFPFEFTNPQKKVVEDIAEDLSSGKLMNRLVQGDVGSGKTAVAEVAMYIAMKSGYQTSYMAPTEILAKQHFTSLAEHFKQFGIKVVLLTGNMKAAEKRNVYEEIKNGKAQGVIGTHAIIQENVEFKNLGLVITDEQHRFGVNQRIKQGSKGIDPHTLIMTATPIPRTLAVVVYGEQEVSIIDSLPAGRKKIETYQGSEKDRNSIYQKLFDEVKEGRQGYVVVPLIEDSEAMEDVKSVDAVYEELKERYRNSDIRLDIIHGGIKQAEKDKLMKSFYDGEIDILVATVVIEVGINVPNATVMVIENAERFGLAQLHQLRGRIGRGNHKSYCYLINNSKSDVAKKRMKIMTSSNDGFYISEKDLELRGPGEVFGTRQHGIPDESLMNAVKHMDILEIAKKDAFIYKEFRNDILEKKIAGLFGSDFTISL